MALTMYMCDAYHLHAEEEEARKCNEAENAEEEEATNPQGLTWDEEV